MAETTTCSTKPGGFPPGHTARLYSPVFLVINCSLETQFQSLETGQKQCISCPDKAHKNLSKVMIPCLFITENKRHQGSRAEVFNFNSRTGVSKYGPYYIRIKITSELARNANFQHPCQTY